MVSENDLAKNSALGHIDLKGLRRRMDAEYNPARLTNTVTGKRELVLLVDIQDEYVEQRLLADCSRNPELQVDMAAALNAFSPIEKRIIFRVLLQGQSVSQATQDMIRSRRHWDRWLTDYALPILRTTLDDYADDLSKIGVYLPSVSPTEPIDESQPQHTVKCKFCTYEAVDVTERLAFAQLRVHANDAHKATYRKVHDFVHDRDYEIQRDEMLLREPKLPEDLGQEEVI